MKKIIPHFLSFLSLLLIIVSTKTFALPNSFALPNPLLRCMAFNDELEFTIYGDLSSHSYPGYNTPIQFDGVVKIRKGNKTTLVAAKGTYTNTGRSAIYELDAIWHGHFDYFQRLNVLINQLQYIEVAYNTSEPEFKRDSSATCSLLEN